MSVANASLQLSGLFEAELLAELMLRYWHHPLSDDREFRAALLERAAEVLKASVDGVQLIQGLNPQDLSLVAAIWYAEWSDIASTSNVGPEFDGRQLWLETVRRALPSCFCDPKLL